MLATAYSAIPWAVLEKRPEARLPSVARAAASPTAVVLAGAGVAVGEAAHLGLPVAIVLGAVGYGGRVAWAAVRRRLALRDRARRRPARVDPWAVPEPWRGYTVRALEARKTFRQLSRECPAGRWPTLGGRFAQGGGRGGGAVGAGPQRRRPSSAPGRPQRVAEDLTRCTGELLARPGADRGPLEIQEAALASQLRSLRQMEAVSTEISARLSALVSQLEGVVAVAGELVATAGAQGPTWPPCRPSSTPLSGRWTRPRGCSRRPASPTPIEPAIADRLSPGPPSPRSV